MTHSKHTDYTERSKEWMKEYKLRAYKFENDPDVALRRADQTCVYCYYSPRYGGQAMTESKCVVCGDEICNANTNTDMVCLTCAALHELCRHCGGDIEMRVRRKRPWPEEVKS